MAEDVLGHPPRVAAVRRLVGAPGQGAGLDALTSLAADLLQVPHVQVSLIGDTEQVVASLSSGGSESTTGPAEDSLCTVTMRQGVPLLVPDATAEPLVCALPPVTSGAVGAYLGVPLRDAAGQSLGALCAFDSAPRGWTASDVALLERLSRAVLAELELRAVGAELQESDARLDLALSAAQIGSFDLDIVTEELQWDVRLQLMFGYTPETFVPHFDSFWSRVDEADAERVREAIGTAVDTCGEFASDYGITTPSGQHKWIQARGRVVIDERSGHPHLYGAATDVTSDRESAAREQRVLESMGDGFYAVDREWRFTYVNARAEQLLGRAREALLGRSIWDEFPDAAGDSPFWHHYQEAMRAGTSQAFEAYYPEPLDGWFAIRVWPTTEGLSVYFVEITAQKRLERQRQDAQRRLALLSSVTVGLMDSLDVDRSMQQLVELLLPELATWSAVSLLGHDDELRVTVAHHVDPDLASVIDRFTALNVTAVNAASLSRAVARTGAPVLRERLSITDVRAGYDDPELSEVLERLGLHSLMVVPLTGRTKVLGVLVLAADESRPPFTPDDLETAVEIGRRAGVAIDNAQLYAGQHEAARVLQASLLAGSLRDTVGLSVRVRYQPADAVASAGGDWHDAVRRPDGSVIVSIGDVMGHDVDATAAMGQVRSLLRGIAYDSLDVASGVLSRVDAAMVGLEVDTLATAVVGCLAADGRTLTWSNAGHPTPLLLRADGRVELLQGSDDLLLGMDPTTVRTDHTVVLGSGDTVVMFTDGLVERRGQDLDDGIEALADTLRSCHGLDLDGLCDGLLSVHAPETRDDDVAMLALRVAG